MAPPALTEPVASLDFPTRPGGDLFPTVFPPAMPAPATHRAGGTAPVDRTRILDVPGYEVLEELGRGGMGVVYKARQVWLNRTVALKMILAGVRAGAQDLARFKLEAEAVASLHHPNIVDIYEVGEHEGVPFFSLEYVDGGCLADKLNGHPQPPRLAAHLVMTLAHAVEAAHRNGIVHRDIKPCNILLAPVPHPGTGSDSIHAEALAAARLYGVPKITDFGLAKRQDASNGPTQSGAIMGTPSYMAPEQAQGKTREIGPPADIYALGAILYECLTGRPPFEAESAWDTIAQVIADEPVSVRSLQPRVPQDLETICRKCLHKEARKRYASALELAEDLRRFLQSEPIRARASGSVERVLKWARRRPALAALIAVSVLAALALAAGGLVYNAQLRVAVRQAEDRAEESRQNLVRLHVANGSSLVDAGDDLGALVWFTEALRLDQGHPEREAMHRLRIAAVLRQCPRLTQVWVESGAVNQVQLSPDGTRAVTARDDGRARVRDFATGQLLVETPPHAGPLVRAVFSADGKWLATASRDGTARVWDATSGRPVSPPLAHGGTLSGLALDPGSRQVVTAGDDGARVWDAVKGRPLARLPHPALVHEVAFAPDGRHLVSACADGAARLWETGHWERAPVRLQHRGPVLHVAFSPDGRWVVTASADHTARIWDTATGVPAGPPLTHGGAVLHAAFSPDGRLVTSAGEDQMAQVWRPRTGERVGRPLQHRSSIRHVAFSPDGNQVATGSDDNMARVWDAATGLPLTPPLRHNGTVNQVVFSRDSQYLITAGDDGTVRVWDVAGLGAAVPGRDWSPHQNGGAGPAREATPLLRSPDGGRVLHIEGARAWVQDAVTGNPVTPPLAHASPIVFADFSPDGRQVVTASSDNTARLWDAATGELLLPPLRHQGTVLNASFRHDGECLVTASADRTARVWDARTGEPLTPPLPHQAAVLRALFSADGRRVLTTDAGGATRSWNLDPDERPVEDLVALAQLLAGTAIDPQRGPMPLDNPQLLGTWERLRDRYPADFTSACAEARPGRSR